jgi:hypothetical protein
MPSPSTFLLRFAAPCVALASAVFPALAADAPVGVDEIVADRSQVEWSESYLQWIAAFAHDRSPISDASGALCGAKQQGDVWFLATSDGTAPVVRACSIPAGKWLFVPIVNTVERSGNKEPLCESMARIASATIASHVGHLSLVVDGQPAETLEAHRLATGTCFSLDPHQATRHPIATTVADGYYVMLKPLARGAHTIAVGAKFDGASISTTYQLDIH